VQSGIDDKKPDKHCLSERRFLLKTRLALAAKLLRDAAQAVFVGFFK